MALTRVLIAFDILHIIQRTPIMADVINWVIAKRRVEIRSFISDIQEYTFGDDYTHKYKEFAIFISGFGVALMQDKEKKLFTSQKDEIHSTLLKYHENIDNNISFGQYKFPIYIIRQFDRFDGGGILTSQKIVGVYDWDWLYYVDEGYYCLIVGEICALASLFFALCVIL